MRRKTVLDLRKSPAPEEVPLEKLQTPPHPPPTVSQQEEGATHNGKVVVPNSNTGRGGSGGEECVGLWGSYIPRGGNPGEIFQALPPCPAPTRKRALLAMGQRWYLPCLEYGKGVGGRTM